ncbi:MAG: hypothetical protein ACLQVD_22445 [Capsulimonadaceae bacterium]
MNLSFLEARDFTAVVDEYFGDDKEFAKFQSALLVKRKRHGN